MSAARSALVPDPSALGAGSTRIVVGHPARGGGQSAVALRILEAAAPLYYRQGIRSVSADVVIAAAGVTKATFYRHFPTKDDLVTAYLLVLVDAEQRAFIALRAEHPGRPGDVLLAYAAALATQACGPGFRGCPFLNAAAEYPDANTGVRGAVVAHRTWLLAAATELLAEIGLADPGPVALALVMLRDGAMVATDLGSSSASEPTTAAVLAALVAAGTTLVRTAPGDRSTPST